MASALENVKWAKVEISAKSFVPKTVHYSIATNRPRNALMAAKLASTEDSVRFLVLKTANMANVLKWVLKRVQ